MVLLTVVLATGNAGKAREFSRLLKDALSVEMMPPWIESPEETAPTFAGNARLKAEAVFAGLEASVPVLADDSGLEVTALGGRPGVLSARFAGEGADDQDNVAKLLLELSGHADRRARFVCSLCLVLPYRSAGATERRLVEVEGSVEGNITFAPRGTQGFGYDPVFIPAGWLMTLAEATPADKDNVSHRGAAARQLITRLVAEGLVDSGP